MGQLSVGSLRVGPAADPGATTIHQDRAISRDEIAKHCQWYPNRSRLLCSAAHRDVSNMVPGQNIIRAGKMAAGPLCGPPERFDGGGRIARAFRRFRAPSTDSADLTPRWRDHIAIATKLPSAANSPRRFRCAQAQAYCRKPTNIRGCSAPPAIRLAATMILPSALTPPLCTLPLTSVNVSTPVEVTE